MSTGAVLTPSDLTMPSDFADAQEWPVFWDSGTVDYVRPSRSATDDNAADAVQSNGLGLDVYIDGAKPLNLTVTASPANPNVNAPVTLSVALPAGAKNETYDWSFDDGSPDSTLASPTRSLPVAGIYDVTVQASGTVDGYGSLKLQVGSPSPRTATTPVKTGPAKSSGSVPVAAPAGASTELRHREAAIKEETAVKETGAAHHNPDLHGHRRPAGRSRRWVRGRRIRRWQQLRSRPRPQLWPGRPRLASRRRLAGHLPRYLAHHSREQTQPSTGSEAAAASAGMTGRSADACWEPSNRCRGASRSSSRPLRATARRRRSQSPRGQDRGRSSVPSLSSCSCSSSAPYVSFGTYDPRREHARHRQRDLPRVERAGGSGADLRAPCIGARDLRARKLRDRTAPTAAPKF